MTTRFDYEPEFLEDEEGEFLHKSGCGRYHSLDEDCTKELVCEVCGYLHVPFCFESNLGEEDG